MPGWPSTRSIGNSGFQPSEAEKRDSHFSKAARGPLSAEKWLASTMRPPGFTTRTASLSTASGSGTTVIRNMATAASKL